MLVLTRKNGQAILIGDNIRIVIIGQRSGETRVGIEAPKEVVVLREELKTKNEKGI